MQLVLRDLTNSDEHAFFEGLKEWNQEKELDWYTFAWKPGMSYSQMLEILDKEVKGIDLAPGRVAHSMLYAFVDGVIVGRLSVRHELNEHLRRRGGHISYAVAEKFRKRGYATEIMRQGLEYCRHLGLNKIMVSCSDANIPSWKIIERFGGVLEDKAWDSESNETIRRYWIDL
jgi:predicted acetyltransferase